jgi:hypothetical protein
VVLPFETNKTSVSDLLPSIILDLIVLEKLSNQNKLYISQLLPDDEKLQNVKKSPKNDHDEHLRKNGRFICHRKPF